MERDVNHMICAQLSGHIPLREKGATTCGSVGFCLLLGNGGPGGDTILEFYFLFKESLFFVVGIIEKKIRRKQRGRRTACENKCTER